MILCGWAGDLQGLVANTLVETNNSQDYSTIYNKFIEIMGHKDYRFSMEDLLADLDAIYIADNITTTEGIGTQIKGYYNGGACNTRFSYFIDDLSKEELTNKIKTYTNLKYLNIVWPLYKSYNVTSISETQANAMSAAFADYLWNRKEVG